MKRRIRGRCWLVGDNVPTDAIVRSHLITRPMEEIRRHVLEGVNPRFPREVQPDDLLVAGRHFGQSSGRAIAVRALKATGVGCVLAESFARTFYRNAFEMGLPILECPGIGGLVSEGDVLVVDLETGIVVDETTGARAQATPIPPFLRRMLEAGGIIPIAKQLAEGTDR
ncbi:MAG TPA: 3-isopropylmalate dehydratase small subunit [Candidatus Dormibacteraeota bacterium]|jgi:3-isopropylmalate/(R)-2-methylmalate dehydratase small subunit|nr:3-isopropylmalate dehydratase small subunit [Candidatus Dormibacteraeota bacterium]